MARTSWVPLSKKNVHYEYIISIYIEQQTVLGTIYVNLQATMGLRLAGGTHFMDAAVARKTDARTAYI